MLDAETMQHTEWPAYSSDLNPVEHIWDALGQYIAVRPMPLWTV